jgi:hypothetical protein
MRHPFAAVLIACGLLASTVAQGLAENYGTLCWTDSRGRRTCQESREYNAAAKCSATNRIGTAYGYPTAEAALQAAIEDCINKGGIPRCCRVGAQLID